MCPYCFDECPYCIVEEDGTVYCTYHGEDPPPCEDWV